MIKLSKKMLTGVFFLVCASVFYFMIPKAMTLSWYLPKFYSLVVMLLSGLLILSGLLRWKKDEKDKIVIDLSRLRQSKHWKTVAFMAMLLVYFILISYLGMVVTTVLFMVAMYLFLGVRDPKIILIALVIMAAVYCGFAFGLRVRFPHGILY